VTPHGLITMIMMIMTMMMMNGDEIYKSCIVPCAESPMIWDRACYQQWLVVYCLMNCCQRRYPLSAEMHPTTARTVHLQQYFK